MGYEWDFGAVWAYRAMFAQGLLGTARIAVVSIALGVLFGALLAALRMSGRRVLAWPALWITEFYRNTPPLVHFFWAYYALPVLLDINLSPYTAAVVALSSQSGAFYAEVFRGGLSSIERGQWEGARAIGMSSLQAMRRIIFPQATLRMVAPFIERSFELIKTTALASTLAYADLLYEAMQVNAITFRPLEVYSTVALMFFVSLLMLSMLARVAEVRLLRAQGGV